jgi:hypothetical protein
MSAAWLLRMKEIQRSIARLKIGRNRTVRLSSEEFSFFYPSDIVDTAGLLEIK